MQLKHTVSKESIIIRRPIDLEFKEAFRCRLIPGKEKLISLKPICLHFECFIGSYRFLAYSTVGIMAFFRQRIKMNLFFFLSLNHGSSFFFWSFTRAE